MIPDLHQISFHGKGSKLFEIYVVNILLTILTLGFYYPWAKASVLRYLYQETELEGSRFVFHGTGKEMFIGFLKAVGIFGALYVILLLTMMSGEPVYSVIGVLAFYVGLLFLFPFAIHGMLRYRTSRSSWRGVHMGYRGNRSEFIKMFIGGLLLSIITLGIYIPWFTIKVRKYVIEHLRFGNIHFRYLGTGDEYFFIMLKGYLLTIITLGVYSFWWARDLYNYYVENLLAYQDEKKISFTSRATPGKYFSLIMGNLAIIVFTLGIGTPWAVVRSMNFMFMNADIHGKFSPEELRQTEKEYKDATAEDMADMLDIDLI